MKPDFIAMLNEPKNTLGRTEEAVTLILENNELIEDLYQCYFQSDEWVRLRVSSSFKRIWRADPTLFKPYIKGFVEKVAFIDQPSVNWTFSQMCLERQDDLSVKQKAAAVSQMKKYLENSDDWIVQNATIETLASWAQQDAALRLWLCPKLQELTISDRKSVAKRAAKWLGKLEK